MEREEHLPPLISIKQRFALTEVKIGVRHGFLANALLAECFQFFDTRIMNFTLALWS